MHKVSIIIVNYNVKKLLVDCLTSIYKNISQDVVEVIVIDNNSSDDSMPVVKEQFPQVKLIENKYNAGFSGANNQGMEVATGEYIFLFNPDTEIVGSAIQDLVKYLSNNQNCAIVAPQLLNSDGSIQTSVWHNHHPFDLIAETFFLHKIHQRLNYEKEKLNTTFVGKTLSGAALFFHKSLIEKMGMLDANLFWMEDIDFSKRAQAYGDLIYLHSAQVYHHSGQSQKKNYNVSIANQLLSKLKYYKKHHTWLWTFLASVCCFIFITSRLMLFTLVTPLKEIYGLKRQAYFYTLKRYFKYILFNDKSLV